MRRRIGLGLLVLVLALIGGHALLWWWTTRRIEAGFDAWAAARRAQGWSVRSGVVSRGGWPLAATVRLADLALEGGAPDLPVRLAWSAERARLSIRLLRPGLLHIAAEGRQTLRLGTLPTIPYMADRLQVTLPLEPGSQQADLAATNLRTGVPVGGEAARSLTIGLLQAHANLRQATLPSEPALTCFVSAEAISLPPSLPWAFGERISSFVVDAALSGPLPRSGGLSRRAETWRDGGGSLTVRHLALGWGPLGLTGTATLALDARMQPMGTSMARVVGYAETLDALGAGGVIGRGAATAATALAALIARAPQAGGPAQIELPLVLRDRTLSIRQMPLVRLPELTWLG